MELNCADLPQRMEKKPGEEAPKDSSVDDRDTTVLQKPRRHYHATDKHLFPKETLTDQKEEWINKK